MSKLDVVRAFSALAQETRVDVVRHLVECGTDGSPAGEIARHLSVSSQTLTFHLRCLVEAGLVTRRRRGRFIIYAARLEVLSELARFLLENCCARQAASCPVAEQGGESVACLTAGGERKM
ncbi:MAG: metalloregulator ArsR/SmtB family transcription factor [Rhizobiales bacterium]|nr:metalloregulator ArsR/SmtB family transcription factor [Hyphomicrobiales bacterium]